MGQEEVIAFFKGSKKKKYCARDISNVTGISIGAVTCSLRKIRDQHNCPLEVSMDIHGRKFHYKWKGYKREEN